MKYIKSSNASGWISKGIGAAERGYVPDSIIRYGIRQLLQQRSIQSKRNGASMSLDDFIAATQAQPIAISTDKANEQHYELPTEFFKTVLGSRLKYSCGYWDSECHSLDDAETAALRLTCDHADLEDGMEILELGCGWGSLSLWLAEKFPKSRITAVSNSGTQRTHIQSIARSRGISNLTVLTCDINHFEPRGVFDRVISVEMFEHIRNHRSLLLKIDRWLRPSGKLLAHIFCHKSTPYLFHSYDEKDWMGKYFFSGGMMPSFDLLPHVRSNFELENTWTWNGLHYAKTCREWLKRQDQSFVRLRPVFQSVYGQKNATIWWNRWRIFFMACEELFAFDQGREWFVAHYLFRKAN